MSTAARIIGSRGYCRYGAGQKEDRRQKGNEGWFNAHCSFELSGGSTIPGTGLGLAITKSIVENLRGHVVLSSVPDSEKRRC